MPSAVVALQPARSRPAGGRRSPASGTSRRTGRGRRARQFRDGPGRGCGGPRSSARSATGSTRPGVKRLRGDVVRLRQRGDSRRGRARRDRVGVGRVGARCRRSALDGARGDRRCRRAARAAALRPAPALRGGAVDRPGRGALGARGGGVRHAGRARARWASRCSPTCGDRTTRSGCGRSRRWPRGWPAPSRPRGSSGPGRWSRTCPDGRSAGSCWSATQPGTSTRSPAEGVALGIATAQAAVDCIVAGRPELYEQRWRAATRRYRALTRAVLFAAQHEPLRRAVVPAASALPPVFRAAVRALA